MIAPEVLEELKYRNDITDVISGYVNLKRAGSNMQGLCPFHSEKSPSFTVFTGSRSFYCFGCGAGGDVITFIMKAENLDYPDALQFLAKRAGMTLPDSRSDARDNGQRKRILAMNRDAARFFHQSLLNSPEALAYLEKRKLSMAAVKHFGIGFAPESFGALTDYLTKRGYSQEDMITGFLCGKSQKTGRPYDYFRKRLIFPLIDTTGEVVAFGGRVLDDSKPKYLNSSDTPVFKKSRNLYALNYAKAHCADRMILCEGYMDVVALHTAGFPIAVATMGTAITPEHARLMKRYTKSVIISYDSDEAGQRAADKAFRLLGEAGLEARILKVENAKDPDEYIRSFGGEAFKKLLDGSKSRFQFQYEGIVSRYNVEETEGKVKAAAELVKVIAQVYSGVERDVYIRQVCRDLQLPYDSMAEDVHRQMKKTQNEAKKEEIRRVVLETEGYGDRINPEAIKNKKAANAEEALLGVLLLYPELMRAFRNSGQLLQPEEFATGFSRRIYEQLLSREDGTFDIAMLGESFTPEEMGRVSAMMAARQGLSKNDLDVVLEYAAILRGEHQKTDDIESILALKRKADKK